MESTIPITSVVSQAPENQLLFLDASFIHYTRR